MPDINVERPITGVNIPPPPIELNLPGSTEGKLFDIRSIVGVESTDYLPGGLVPSGLRPQPGLRTWEKAAGVEAAPVGPMNLVFNLCVARGEPTPSTNREYFQGLLNLLDGYFSKSSYGRSGIDFSKTVVTDWTSLNRDWSSFDPSDAAKMRDELRGACQGATDPKVDNRGRLILINVIGNHDVGAFSKFLTVNLDGEEKMVSSVIIGEGLNINRHRWAIEHGVVVHEILRHFIGSTKVKVGQDAGGKPVYDWFIDPWTPMSSVFLGDKVDPKYGHIPVQLNAPERLIMGWGKNVVEVASGQRQNIDLAALSDQSVTSFAQIVKIPLEDGFLTAEYRTPTESDPVGATGIAIYFVSPSGEKELMVPSGKTAGDPWRQGMTFSRGKATINIGQNLEDLLGAKIVVQNGEVVRQTPTPTQRPAFPRPTTRPPATTRPAGYKIFAPYAGSRDWKK